MDFTFKSIKQNLFIRQLYIFYFISKEKNVHLESKQGEKQFRKQTEFGGEKSSLF